MKVILTAYSAGGNLELISKLYELFVSGKRKIYPDGMIVIGVTYPILIEAPWTSKQFIVENKEQAERLKLICERVLEVAKDVAA